MKSVKPASTEKPRDIFGNISKWSVSEKIDIIESGISKLEFEEIKRETGLDYKTLSQILTTTRATLYNKRGNAKFNVAISEHLLLLSELYADGFEVFGEKERFNRWLVSEIRALGFRRPIDLLNTTLGMQEVRRIIGRISHGIIS